MKKWSKKKLALVIGGSTLAVALIIGGILYYLMNPGRKTVDVYSVETLNNAEWFESESTLSGTVTSQYVQEVYLSGTNDVKEIYVKEGDAVKEGDSLMKYDMDEEEVDLQLKELEIKSSEYDIQDLETELEKLKKTKTTSALDSVTNALKASAPSIEVMAAEGDPESTTATTEAPVATTATATTEAPEATTATKEAPATTETPTTENKTDSTTATKDNENTGGSSENGTTETTQNPELKRSLSYLDPEAWDSTYTGDGKSIETAYIFNIRQGKEKTTSQDSAATTEADSTDQTVEGFISGKLLNELISANKYFIINEYASTEAYYNGESAVNTITVTPDTQFCVSFDDDQNNYTLSYLQKKLITVTSLKIQASSKKVYKGSSYTYPVKVNGTNVSSVSLTWSISGNKSSATIISGGNLVVGSTEKSSSITIKVSACGVSDTLKLKVKKNPASSGSSSGSASSGSTETTYTKSELAEAISQKEEEIAEAKQDLAQAKIDYQEQQKEIAKAVVKATVSGIVTKACSVKDLPADGSAVIVVKAEEGMYVKAEISEMLLDTIKVGGTITCTSWETNESYEAEIREISDYPSSSTASSDGSTNPNSSYYPIMAYIAEPGDLSNGDSVSITYSSQSMGTISADAIVIQKAYVRTDAGQSYVYKQGEDGKLVKQNVKIGSTVYGQYVEITAGLSKDDYIAFPYGKNVAEGAKTQISEDDENIVY